MKYLILLSFAMLFGCGDSYESDDGGSGPAPSPVTEEQQLAWDSTVQPIVAANCALSGCHANAGFVKSPAGFLGSGAKAQIRAGKMPKGRTLSAAQKSALLGL